MTTTVVAPSHPARTRGWSAVLGAALNPLTGARLAHLRTAELRLAVQHPRPTVITVLGMAPQLGTSLIAALLAQTLQGVAAGRVAVLDCDGAAQPQRRLLGAQSGGDVQAMLSSRSAWRIRRAVERYACPETLVPLYCAGVDTRSALTAADVLAAVRLIRRRYPVVVLDVPIESIGDLPLQAVRAADHVVAVIPADAAGAAIRTWIGAVHPGVGLTVAGPRGPDNNSDADLVLPIPSMAAPDRAAPDRVAPDRAALATAALPLLAAVEELAVRVTQRWRATVLPTVKPE